MWWIFVAQSLQDYKTIRSVNYKPFRSYRLDIKITVLCTWNTLALKLIIRSFPALFCVRIGKVSLMLCLSRIGLRSGHADMGLSKISSHGEERKALQLSELLRQPQEHELSVTSVAWRAPGAQQSAFGHPTSKWGQETQNLPGHIAFTKGEPYPMGSAEAPKKEKEDLWNKGRLQVCYPESRAPSSWALGPLPHNSVLHYNASPLKYPDIFCSESPGLPLPLYLKALWWLCR